MGNERKTTWKHREKMKVKKTTFKKMSKFYSPACYTERKRLLKILNPQKNVILVRIDIQSEKRKFGKKKRGITLKIKLSFRIERIKKYSYTYVTFINLS